MRVAQVFVDEVLAGYLTEESRTLYRFEYLETYKGYPVSLTMPVKQKSFIYERFPPFFDGLLPEGMMLDGLLRTAKIDRNDHFSQLLAVGEDVVGNVTVRPV